MQQKSIPYRAFFSSLLVQHCYHRVLGKPLVDERSLPLTPLDEIVAVWPHASRAGLRSRLGLPGPGPWDVLLPGHVFHAIDQAGDRPFSLPFRAQAEHASFPLSDYAWQRALDDGWYVQPDGE